MNLSGIVTIIFCGISMTRYALPNVTAFHEKLNNKFYHTIAHSCENIIFIFIGLGIVSLELAWV